MIVAFDRGAHTCRPRVHMEPRGNDGGKWKLTKRRIRTGKTNSLRNISRRAGLRLRETANAPRS
ncbi:MAG: hypothetical protein ACRYHA_17640, partial [Janthinobacterium lividum]